MKSLLTILGLFFSIVSSGQSFTDVAASAGLNHEFHVGDFHFGGGAAVIDFDNDGFEDIYLIGGSNDDKLYRNNGLAASMTFHLSPGSHPRFLFTQLAQSLVI